MENYLTQLNRATKTTKFILPSYVKLIDELRKGENEYVKIKRELFDTNEQVHLMWINTGLLAFIPNEADASYIHPKMDVLMTVDQQYEEKQRRQQARMAAEFGDFKDAQIMPWNEGAKQVLANMVTDVCNFMNLIDATFKGETRPAKDLKKTCCNADTFDITKQLRFVAIGLLHKNKKTVPAISLYQHLVCRIPAEIMMKGAAYRADDVTFYESLKPSNLCTQSPIIIGGQEISYISRVIEFNPREDVWYQTGGSVLLTSGLRFGSDKMQSEGVHRGPASKIEMLLDDDDSSEEDIKQ